MQRRSRQTAVPAPSQKQAGSHQDCQTHDRIEHIGQAAAEDDGEALIGSDRKRSVTPFEASEVTAIIVASRPKHGCCEHAGHQEIEVALAGTWIAPPKSSPNISTIMTGKNQPRIAAAGCMRQCCRSLRAIVQASASVQPKRENVEPDEAARWLDKSLRSQYDLLWLFCFGNLSGAGTLRRGSAGERDVFRLDPRL